MVTGGAVCSNWACTESVRGEVSDGLPYLDHITQKVYKFQRISTVVDRACASSGCSVYKFLRISTVVDNDLGGGADTDVYKFQRISTVVDGVFAVTPVFPSISSKNFYCCRSLLI